MFAGVWRTWSGDYGSKIEPNLGEHHLFSFLTTAANDLVRPVHAKAMRVVIAKQERCEEWLGAPASEIERLQARVLPTDALEIISDAEAEAYAGNYIG